MSKRLLLYRLSLVAFVANLLARIIVNLGKPVLARLDRRHREVTRRSVKRVNGSDVDPLAT